MSRETERLAVKLEKIKGRIDERQSQINRLRQEVKSLENERETVAMKLYYVGAKAKGISPEEIARMNRAQERQNAQILARVRARELEDKLSSSEETAAEELEDNLSSSREVSNYA